MIAAASARGARLAAVLALVAAGAMLAAAPARADAIDGEWCLAAATFKIDGPSIRTQGGQTTTGQYGRHDFHYVVPPGEAGAGTEISMRLLNDENLTLTRRAGASVSPPESWIRCKPVS